MPYKNPNYCLSEKYFAKKEQQALAYKNSMTQGLFTLLSVAATDGEVTYADQILDSLGIPSDIPNDVTFENNEVDSLITFGTFDPAGPFTI